MTSVLDRTRFKGSKTPSPWDRQCDDGSDVSAETFRVPLQHLPGVGNSALHGARGRGERTDQQSSRPHTLAALEVAIAGADRILAGGDGVAVHPQAHRAAGLAPIRPGRLENVGVARGFGFALDLLRTRHDEQAHPGRDFAAFEYVRGRLQIGESPVGAAADEYYVDRLAQHSVAAVQPHVTQRLLENRVP